jgi:hypothetical protein
MTNALALARVPPNAQWQYLMENGVTGNFGETKAKAPVGSSSRKALLLVLLPHRSCLPNVPCSEGPRCSRSCRADPTHRAPVVPLPGSYFNAIVEHRQIQECENHLVYLGFVMLHFDLLQLAES